MTTLKTELQPEVLPEAPGPSYHMSAAEFRAAGYALIDWIAAYHERVESLPVLAQVKPGEVRSHLPPSPPNELATNMPQSLPRHDEKVMRLSSGDQVGIEPPTTIVRRAPPSDGTASMFMFTPSF